MFDAITLVRAHVVGRQLVTIHSATLSSGEHVLSQGIYVVGIGCCRSSMVVH